MANLRANRRASYVAMSPTQLAQLHKDRDRENKRASQLDQRASIRDSVLREVLTCQDDLDAFHRATSKKAQSTVSTPSKRGTFGAKGPELAPIPDGPGPGQYEVQLPRGYASSKHFQYLSASPHKEAASAMGDGPGILYDRPLTLTRPSSPGALLSGGPRTPLEKLYIPPT